MEIKIYHTPPPESVWEALVPDTESQDFFSTPGWYRVFTESVANGDGGIEFVTAFDEHGHPAALLPLWRHQTPGLLRTSALSSLTNYYSCLFQFLVCKQPDLAEHGLNAIVDYLLDTRKGWSSLSLRPLPTDSRAAALIESRFRERGMVTRRDVTFTNWFLDCTDLDFEHYQASRRKTMRSTVRSKTKQLSKLYTLEFEIVTSPELTQSAVDAYNRVYELSWKQAEPYPKFIPELAAHLAENGELRLGLFKLDGRTVGAQLWFVHDGVANIFKLAYDPEFSQYSVGTLLTMKMVEHCMTQDKVTMIDFLSGDDEYKKHWMSDRRERVSVEVLNPQSLGGMMTIVRRGLGNIKRRIAP